MVIEDLLKEGNEILKNSNIDDYAIKTRLLLSNILNKNKEYLMIHNDEIVDKKCVRVFFEKIELLKNGFPIQYIINKQEFMGIEFFVNENVLIPQPDTEILVEEILKNISDNDKILDLCTGSGAIGISISKLSKKKINVFISDISRKALDVAKLNIENNNIEINVIESDLFENINDKFNVIVSNPPYIETDIINNLSSEVKNEPIIALDGGKDGLEFYRRIAKNAKKYLFKDGILGLEIGYNQKNDVIDILKQECYINIYSKKDYSGNDRIIICKRGE